MITIYTDGSFNIVHGVGGWAAVVLDNGAELEYSGNTDDSNNLSGVGSDKMSSQRMEIIAVLEALLTLTKPSTVEIISDSKYVVDTMSKGWLEKWIREKDNDKKHLDLWRVIYALSKLHKLKFTWVKGHSGDYYNERCDYLAQKETKKVLTTDERILTLAEIADMESKNNNTSSPKDAKPSKNTKQHPGQRFTSNELNGISSSEVNSRLSTEANSDSENLFNNESTPFDKSSQEDPEWGAELTKTTKGPVDSSRRSSGEKKKVYYAVAKGRKTGILNSWIECSKSVNRYKGAIFKKFDNKREALEFIEDNK